MRLDELHPLFRKIPRDEAVAVANLGAVCYQAARERLYETWTAAQSEGAAAREAACRQEGADALLESLESRLAAGTAAQERLAVMEATLKAEVAQRLEAAMATERMALEVQRVMPLQVRLSALEAKDEMGELLRQNNMRLQGQLTKLEEELTAARARIEELKEAGTKSSHAIGKAGEATVWDMIENTVLPEFPYSSAKNMAGVSHAADFHLWVMAPSGQRVKILIDSKKYKRAVNSDEIAKLVADVDGDDEAHAGLLVSLASPISTMKQFQIQCTDKGKPVLYLSFSDISVDQHTKILCWGIRALISAVHDDRNGVSVEVARVEELLSDISQSLKEVDVMVKAHQKLLDGMRSMKISILQRITDFRGGETSDIITHEEDLGCVVTIKATGARCGKPTYNGTKCKHHTSRKEKDVVGGGHMGN